MEFKLTNDKGQTYIFNDANIDTHCICRGVMYEDVLKVSLYCNSLPEGLGIIHNNNFISCEISGYPDNSINKNFLISQNDDGLAGYSPQVVIEAGTKYDDNRTKTNDIQYMVNINLQV